MRVDLLVLVFASTLVAETMAQSGSTGNARKKSMRNFQTEQVYALVFHFCRTQVDLLEGVIQNERAFVWAFCI